MKRIIFSIILLCSLCSWSALAQGRHLTILHFNDLHGQLEAKCSEKKCAGGAARLATIVKEIKKDNEAKGWDTLLLFSGDAFSGSLISSVFRGEAEFDFFNAVGVDAMVIGNHDFDFSVSILEDRMDESKFPVLSANTYWKGTDHLFAKPFYIDNLKNMSVGIVGLTTTRTPAQTNPRNVVDLTFRDENRAAGHYLKKIKSTDFKIALTHMGVKKDEELALRVRGFNVVVGGHDHVKPAEHCRTVAKTPVCQAPANGRYLGRLDFEIDNKQVTLLDTQLIAIDDRIKEDQKIAALVGRYAREVDKEKRQVIGHALTSLSRGRGQETILGDLITDAMRVATGTDVSFINDGGIRAAINKGPITFGEIAEVLPFDNYVVSLKLSGEELQEVFNLSAARGSNAFLQVSGISFKILDNKAVNIRVGKHLINPKKKYAVATVDFLATGGDGYTLLKDKERESTGKLVRDIVVDYIKDKKNISAPPSGRIIK